MSFVISISLCVLLFVVCCDCAFFIKDSEVKLKSEPGIGTNKMGGRYRRQVWMRFCSQGEQYNPMVELCCNGHVVPLVGNRTRCCGDNSFDPWSEMCCDETTNTILPRMTQPACCGSDLYDAASDMCCGTTVFYRVPTRGVPKPILACCGDRGYDTTRQICCQENLSPIPRAPGALPACCGGRGYDAATHLCCEGRPTYRPSNMSACCGQFSTYNTATQICCSGFAQNINQNGTPRMCCDGVMQPKRLATDTCCGTMVYNPTTHRCCDGAVPVSLIMFNGGCGGLA